MHKLLNLVSEDIVNFYDAIEHHYETNGRAEDMERGQIICDYLRPLKSNKNIKWTLWCEEAMPQTSDNTLNYLTAQLAILLDAVDNGADDAACIFMENLFWQYMEDNHAFDLEEHNLDKHTSHEAQVYAILHIASREPNFYDEGVAFE